MITLLNVLVHGGSYVYAIDVKAVHNTFTISLLMSCVIPFIDVNSVKRINNEIAILCSRSPLRSRERLLPLIKYSTAT